MVLVEKKEFDEMMKLGFIKHGDYATTMKCHSKSRRHKHYCREDKYAKYLKWKKKQNNNNKG